MLHTLFALFVAAFTSDHSLLLIVAPFLMAPVAVVCVFLSVAYPAPYGNEARALDGWGVVYTLLCAAMLSAPLYMILSAFAPYL